MQIDLQGWVTKGMRNGIITLSMATQGIERIGRRDIKKFIIQHAYGTNPEDWPSGTEATIVLSTVTICYTQLSPAEVSQDCKLTINSIYKNREHPDHAEGLFLSDLRQQIGKLEVKEIQVNLVQNYSPCNNYKQERKSGCADDILSFKDDMSKQKIKFSLTITFANFYKHKDPANREGLINLLQSGIKLKLLRDKDKWEVFLRDGTFVTDLADREYDKLLKDATSAERKIRETDDRKIIQELRQGEQMASFYPHIQYILNVAYNWSFTFTHA